MNFQSNLAVFHADLFGRGERGNIGFVADAVAQNFFERQSTLAVSNDAGKAPA